MVWATHSKVPGFTPFFIHICCRSGRAEAPLAAADHRPPANHAVAVVGGGGLDRHECRRPGGCPVRSTVRISTTSSLVVVLVGDGLCGGVIAGGGVGWRWIVWWWVVAAVGRRSVVWALDRQ